MNYAQSSLATKFVAGVTAVVMTMTAFAGFAPTAQAASSDTAALCAVVADLQAAGNSNATLDALAATVCNSSSDNSDAGSTAGTGEYIYHPAIDFEFTRNLYIGSRGNDVKMLQKALNSMADTQVAVSGAGSPGNETEYFGPATRNAVIAFQAKTGVTPALGYFYPLTRAKMNEKAAGSSNTGDTGSTSNDGDLNVSEKGNPDDDLFPQGVVRFVVAGFELDGEADVESITVRYNGDADEDDVIKDVMLLDEDMNILGDEESLDSDQEAKINVDVEVDGEVMMYVAVNATNSTSGFDDNDGLEFTFDVVEIEADGDVDGLPVSGAEFTVQDNIDLGDIEVTLKNENKTVEIGSEEEEIVEVEVNANPDDSDDSVFVKSIRLTNEGTGDLEDLDNVYIEVDNEEFDGEIDSQDDDVLVFNFGNGFELEDGDSEKFTVYADVTGGATDTFRFEIDENSDVYAESEDGYGMPFASGSDLDGNGTNEVTISAGDVSLTSNDDEEADEITVGDDIVLGMFDLEVEGEDITVDELKVVIAISAASSTDGDIDDLLLEDVRLELDGNALTDNEDADWDGGTPTVAAAIAGNMFVEFDNVEFPEGDHEGIMIVATIADEVTNGSIYEVANLTDSSFTKIEGAESDEDITLGSDSASFDPRTVEAANLKVTVEANTPSTADRTTTEDVTDFHMATIEFDARSSGEDIEVSSFELELTFVASTTAAVPSTAAEIEELRNCRLFDEDTDAEYELNDEVEGDEGDTTYEFELDDVMVIPADENVKVEVRCDIGDDLNNGDTFTWEILATSDVVAEGAITGNDENDGVVEITPETAATITIASATVTAQRDSDAPDAQVVKFGQEVVLGITEVESDNGEATIEKVSVSLSTVNVIDDGEVFLYFEGSEEDSIELVADGAALMIDNLNIKVEDGENIQLEFRGDASLSNTGATTLTVTAIELDDGTVITPTGTYDSVTVFEGVPVITLVSDETNDNLDTSNDAEIFEISIEADGEDVTVDEIILDFDLANTVVSDARFEVFENAAHTNEAGTNNESTALAAAISVDGESTFVFASPIVIPDGDTYYFVLIGDPTVSDDTRSVRVKLEDVATKGVSFTTPAALTDSSVVLEDDIEVLHRD